MATSMNELPRFAKPPVVETVLGVHFRPLEKLTSAHQGLLWEQCFRPRFPKLEERPPVEEARERFGKERLVGTPTVRWRVQDRPDVPRLWAASENGEHVVQIQRGAFFANWLKTAEEVAYWPYVERRQEFHQQLAQVHQFVRDEGLGRIELTSCVVTYINHIDYGGLDEIGPALARVLTCWTDQTSDGWLPDPDRVVLDFAFPMPEQTGRLNVQMKPIVRRGDKKQMLRLELTARSAVRKRDLAEAIAWMDTGHEWVVRGFASLTRPEMHHLWERIQ
jgi:uncharacterized protein (TIGR04255 family)